MELARYYMRKLSSYSADLLITVSSSYFSDASEHCFYIDFMSLAFIASSRR